MLALSGSPSCHLGSPRWAWRRTKGRVLTRSAPTSGTRVASDVWIASHATPLTFVNDSDAHSAVIVTTRMRSLLEGAAEVQCGMLSKEASLELLLRTGGCEHLLDAPPVAAIEAVELCDRLPLALGIAGGMIATLGTSWEAEICELLKDELEEASIEERVVTASLRVVPEASRVGVEGLFTLFAVFAEEYVHGDRPRRSNPTHRCADTLQRAFTVPSSLLMPSTSSHH